MGERIFLFMQSNQASCTLKSKFLHIDELKAVNIKAHNDAVEACIA